MKNKVKKMNITQLVLHTLCIALAAVFAHLLLDLPKEVVHIFDPKRTFFENNEQFVLLVFALTSWFSFIGAAFSIMTIVSDKKGKAQGSGNFYGQLMSFPSTIIAAISLIGGLYFVSTYGYPKNMIGLVLMIITIFNNFLAIMLSMISMVTYLVKGRKKGSQEQSLQEANAQ